MRVVPLLMTFAASELEVAPSSPAQMAALSNAQNLSVASDRGW